MRVNLLLLLCGLWGCKGDQVCATCAPDLTAMSEDAGAGIVGRPCTRDSDCPGIRCVTEAQDGRYIGGYCSFGNCDRVDMACLPDSDCKGEARYGADTLMICLVRCRTDGGPGACRPGYRCCSGAGPLRLEGWCAPEQGQICLLK